MALSYSLRPCAIKRLVKMLVTQKEKLQEKEKIDARTRQPTKDNYSTRLYDYQLAPKKFPVDTMSVLPSKLHSLGLPQVAKANPSIW